MAIMNAIQNALGQVWCRKSKTWINPEEFTEYALQVRCAYPTFAGCNQAAYRIGKGSANFTAWPKQWGRLHIQHKQGAQS
jgi:hypothetical protein